jgi:DNA-binding transcriptional regulator YbjK
MAEYGWVEVGTAEVTYTFNPIDDGIAEAIAACDLAEAKLRSDLNDKLAEILDIRQRLLCLPSPKEPFDA